jgi:hypothetical protein
MTDMQITVWFGWEAGVNPSTEFARLQILIDDVPDEIGRKFGMVGSHILDSFLSNFIK